MPELSIAPACDSESHVWSVSADNGPTASLTLHTSPPSVTSALPTNLYPNRPDPDPREGTDRAAEKERWIWVLDPLTRKLRVPISQLVPTQATATSGTVPSLCISFLEGRCRHQWCRQAHVLPSAIPQLRYEALHAPTCCRVHDDPHDTSVLVSRFRFIRIVNAPSHGTPHPSPSAAPRGEVSDMIPTNRVAQTVGLLRFMAHSVPGTPRPDDDVLDLPAKLICRLHLAHRCRYLEDCNNIHICRAYDLRLQPPPHVLAALAAIGPATRTVSVGDGCYAATALAVGAVSDDAFRAVCEQQRRQLRVGVPAWLDADADGLSPTAEATLDGGTSALRVYDVRPKGNPSGAADGGERNGRRARESPGTPFTGGKGHTHSKHAVAMGTTTLTGAS